MKYYKKYKSEKLNIIKVSFLINEEISHMGYINFKKLCDEI